MSDVDSIKDEIRKLSAKAMQAKMDLHDLSEELPIGWDRCIELATRTEAAYKALEAKRAELKSLQAAG